MDDITGENKFGTFTIGASAVPASGRVRAHRVLAKSLDKQPLVVWGCVGSVVETCDYGDDHEIVYFIRKKIFPTNKTVSSYVQGSDEKIQEVVWVDGRGVEYHHKSTVDFYSNSYWARQVDGERLFFYTSPHMPTKSKSMRMNTLMSQQARDYFGRGLVIGGRRPPAPDGQSWDTLQSSKKFYRR